MKNIRQDVSNLVSFMSDTHQSILGLTGANRLSVSINYVNSLQGFMVITEGGYSGKSHTINIDYCLRNGVKPKHVAKSIIDSEDRMRINRNKMAYMSVRAQQKLAYTLSFIQALKAVK